MIATIFENLEWHIHRALDKLPRPLDMVVIFIVVVPISMKFGWWFGAEVAFPSLDYLGFID